MNLESAQNEYWGNLKRKAKEANAKLPLKGLLSRDKVKPIDLAHDDANQENTRRDQAKIWDLALGQENADQKRANAIEKIRNSVVMIIEDLIQNIEPIKEELGKIGKTENVFVARSYKQAGSIFDQALSEPNLSGNTIFMILDLDMPYGMSENIDSEAIDRGVGMEVLADAQRKLQEYNRIRQEKGQPIVKLEVVFNTTNLATEQNREENLEKLLKRGNGVNIEGAAFSPKKEAAVDTLINHITEKRDA